MQPCDLHPPPLQDEAVAQCVEQKKRCKGSEREWVEKGERVILESWSTKKSKCAGEEELQNDILAKGERVCCSHSPVRAQWVGNRAELQREAMRMAGSIVAAQFSSCAVNPDAKE